MKENGSICELRTGIFILLIMIIMAVIFRHEIIGYLTRLYASF